MAPAVFLDPIGTAVAFVIDGLMPPACIGCKAATARAGLYCPACWAELAGQPMARCDRCAIPLPLAWSAESHCLACVRSPPPFVKARTAHDYAGPARATVLAFKNGREALASRMAADMARAADGLGLAPETLVLPVPLHRWRLFRRGFNQAAWLARDVAARLDLAFSPDALRRIRPTPSTRGLGRQARHRVMAGAFAVYPGARSTLADRPILLVDDVLTSGATAAACTRALTRAGAGPVSILTYARVAGPEALSYVAELPRKDRDGRGRDLHQVPVPLLHPGEEPAESQRRDLRGA